MVGEAAKFVVVGFGVLVPAIRVDCPKCGAAPGAPCPRPDPHARRFAAARAESIVQSRLLWSFDPVAAPTTLLEVDAVWRDLPEDELRGAVFDLQQPTHQGEKSVANMPSDVASKIREITTSGDRLMASRMCWTTGFLPHDRESLVAGRELVKRLQAGGIAVRVLRVGAQWADAKTLPPNVWVILGQEWQPPAV